MDFLYEEEGVNLAMRRVLVHVKRLMAMAGSGQEVPVTKFEKLVISFGH